MIANTAYDSVTLSSEMLAENKIRISFHYFDPDFKEWYLVGLGWCAGHGLGNKLVTSSGQGCRVFRGHAIVTLKNRQGPPMNDRKRILMTGATDGIGIVTAGILLRDDIELIILCRNPEKGARVRERLFAESGNPHISLVSCDLASLSSIRQAAEQIASQFAPLDVVINCAGIYQSERQESVDGFEMHLAVNYLSGFLLTRLLLPAMNKQTPARILMVSGETARFGRIHFDDLNCEAKFSTLRAYAQSKLANIMFAFSLSERLVGSNISCAAMHPGPAATGHLQAGPGWLSWFWSHLTPKPDSAARRVAAVALMDPSREKTLNYYFGKTRFFAPGQARRKADRDRLWEVTSRMLALPEEL